MSKRSKKSNDLRFWLKVITIVASFLGISVYSDHRLEAAICDDLSSKVFDYDYWVVCEQFRLADKLNFLMNGELPNEETPKVEEADAL